MQILDFEQFWLDLSEANQNGTAIWKSEYIFTEYFGVKNLTTLAFQEIFQKMSSDPDFFDKYHQINSVQKADVKCDENCRTYHLCAISQQNYKYFDECIERNHSNKAQLGIFLFIISLIFSNCRNC